MEKKILGLVLSLGIVAVFQCANAIVPAVFILGDSTADIGTNNFLPGSKDRVDFLPYGIDFPHHRPTGRFSNGLNSADFLAKQLGFKRSPLPYFIIANNTKFIKRPSFRGVNFASGGSGLLNITGQDPNPNGPKNVIPFGEQIEQLSSIVSELVAIKGQYSAQSFLSKSLFVISIGSNDIFGFQLSNSSLPKQEFIATLGIVYEKYIRNMYELGARKFGIISVPPIGCCPFERAQNSTGGCLENLNDLARDFYSMINTFFSKISSDYTDFKYSLGNAVEMTLNVIYNPSPYGFNNVQNACCGGALNLCGPNTSFCSNRHEYLFWDAFHPTVAASRLAALTLYDGEPRFVSPITFRQLAEA